jgi:hypothetical protein
MWSDGTWNDYKYQLKDGPQGPQLVLAGEDSREVWSRRN